MRLARRRSLAIAILALALAAFPLGTLASHDFTDVPDSNPFHNDIDAIADAGVTSGCGGGNYCPSAFVTREQMAAFLNRLGALGAGKVPVVNADRLDGLDSSDLLLGESDLHLRQTGTWAVSSADAATTTVLPGLSTRVLRNGMGASTIHLPLVAPTYLGGRTFGLSSVTVCSAAGTNVSATQTDVTDVKPISSFGYVFITPYDLTAAGCNEITMGELLVPDGGLELTLHLAYSAAGGAILTHVETVWLPVPLG